MKGWFAKSVSFKDGSQMKMRQYWQISGGRIGSLVSQVHYCQTYYILSEEILTD